MPILREPVRRAFKAARHDREFYSPRVRRTGQTPTQAPLSPHGDAPEEQPTQKSKAVAEPPVKTAHQRIMEEDEY